MCGMRSEVVCQVSIWRYVKHYEYEGGSNSQYGVVDVGQVSNVGSGI